MAVATQNRLASEIKVSEVMARNVHSCMPVDDIRDALELMQRERVRRLPVLDGRGALAGVLSLNDVIRNSAKVRTKKQVSYRRVMITLKGVCRPHDAARPAGAPEGQAGAEAPGEGAEAAAPANAGEV